nr:polysaccharide biosynthesis C-terminal domain-containing protein [Sphingomonas sp.]
ARKDMKTPVIVAFVALVLGVGANFALIPAIGIAALPATTAASAWLNALTLYAILARRGHFHFEGWLVSRLVRQLVAAAAMAGALYGVQLLLAGRFAGSAGERLLGVAALVGVGGAVYFTVAWVIGAMNRDDVRILLRRKAPASDP